MSHSQRFFAKGNFETNLSVSDFTFSILVSHIRCNEKSRNSISNLQLDCIQCVWWHYESKFNIPLTLAKLTFFCLKQLRVIVLDNVCRQGRCWLNILLSKQNDIAMKQNGETHWRDSSDRSIRWLCFLIILLNSQSLWFLSVSWFVSVYLVHVFTRELVWKGYLGATTTSPTQVGRDRLQIRW